MKGAFRTGIPRNRLGRNLKARGLFGMPGGEAKRKGHFQAGDHLELIPPGEAT